MQSSSTIIATSATPSASSNTSTLAHAAVFQLQLLRWHFCSSNSDKKLEDLKVSNHNIVAIAFRAGAILTSFNCSYASCSNY